MLGSYLFVDRFLPAGWLELWLSALIMLFRILIFLLLDSRFALFDFFWSFGYFFTISILLWALSFFLVEGDVGEWFYGPMIWFNLGLLLLFWGVFWRERGLVELIEIIWRLGLLGGLQERNLLTGAVSERIDWVGLSFLPGKEKGLRRLPQSIHVFRSHCFGSFREAFFYFELFADFWFFAVEGLLEIVLGLFGLCFSNSFSCEFFEVGDDLFALLEVEQSFLFVVFVLVIFCLGQI